MSLFYYLVDLQDWLEIYTHDLSFACLGLFSKHVDVRIQNYGYMSVRRFVSSENITPEYIQN